MRTLACFALATCACAAAAAPPVIRTLGNRADLVSGGDALVEIVAPAGTAPGELKVTVNGEDVSSAFAPRADGRITGVVGNLRAGRNVVAASAGRAGAAQLVVTNAARSGPVLSGPQPVPFHCATPVPRPGDGTRPQTAPSGLAGEPDANCNIGTEFTLFYRTTLPTPAGGCPLPDPYSNSAIAQPKPAEQPCWKPYTAGTQPPDMAGPVRTDAGVAMPFIVRLERGTLNRGIYDIAVLFDPARPWTATEPQPGWNGKVFYSFGPNTGQPRRQVRPATAWSGLEEQLRRGFLVAQNSMSDSSRNSNRVMVAETVMMMKEHIVDSYGPVKYTVGTGCSGGSINANTTVSVFPGLLDGVITSCTYPDSESTALEVADCTLLVEAYQKPALQALWSGAGLSPAQVNARKAAINGHPDQSGCQAWYNLFGNNARVGIYAERMVLDPGSGALVNTGRLLNNCELPNAAVYDPANSLVTSSLPRCDAWSWASSVWGRGLGSPATRRTTDNVGVQYGLAALLQGTIGAEEFVTLNESVGGFDREGEPRAARSSGDLAALETAYRAGIVASGTRLAQAAIIDLRGWDDSTLSVPPDTPRRAIYGIHHRRYSDALRERIVRDEGDAGNQVMWSFARGGLEPPRALLLEALDAMDAWLAAVHADTSDRPLEHKLRQARPASLRDFCLPTADAAQRTRVADPAACAADPFLKSAASPRQVAGGPRSEDILKCQLKPLVPTDYAPGTFTPAQFARLQAVFPGGVCDWSKPGMGQQVVQSPLSFRAGPAGQPLGDPPQSAPR